MEHVKDNPAVIGYQVDNETKSYGTAGPNVQALFVKYMKPNTKRWIISTKYSAWITGATASITGTISHQ
jgi:hypothetical protein